MRNKKRRERKITAWKSWTKVAKSCTRSSVLPQVKLPGASLEKLGFCNCATVGMNSISLDLELHKGQKKTMRGHGGAPLLVSRSAAPLEERSCAQIKTKHSYTKAMSPSAVTHEGHWLEKNLQAEWWNWPRNYFVWENRWAFRHLI